VFYEANRIIAHSFIICQRGSGKIDETGAE
jgi:hypothetical protein